MKLILLICAALLLLGLFWSPLQAISWKTYTDSREVSALFAHESYIWSGTSGGVLRFATDGSDLRKYTNSEGLGDNTIVSGIAAGGYVWFGSDTGKLSRFDPSDSSWTVYLLLDRDGDGISINDMATLDDFLWLATEIGISKFDMFRHGGEVKETYRRLGDFTVETPIQSISICGDTVVAVSSEGVAFADANDQFLQDFTHWRTATETTSALLPDVDFRSAVAYGDSYIIGTSSGLYRLVDSDSLFYWDMLGLSGTSITEIDQCADSLILTATNGVYIFYGFAISEYDLTGFPGVPIRVSLRTDGGMVIGTAEEGIYVEESDWMNLQVPGPASNSIVDVGTDSKGTIWTVVKEPFFSALAADEWSHYELPYSGGSQWALEVDRFDAVWIGTWQNGALKFDGETLTKYDHTNSSLMGVEENPFYTVILDIDIDESGRIWFACYRGHPLRPVSFYDPSDDKWDYYSDDEGFSHDRIRAIHVEGDILWTGFENSGLYRTELGSDPFDHTGITSRRYDRSQHLPSDNIRIIESDLEGTVWIGTNAGLAYYDEGIDWFIRVDLPTGSGPQVNAIETDPRNNLWIGTSNSLVSMLADGSGFEVFTTANSRIAGNEITSLHYHEGFVWVGTSSGLSRLDYDIGRLSEAVEEVVAYPNPFIVPEHSRVFFSYDGIADISVFTLAGELVKETSTSEGWDGLNESGELVASGMYLFHILTPEGESHTGKIALIRK